MPSRKILLCWIVCRTFWRLSTSSWVSTNPYFDCTGGLQAPTGSYAIPGTNTRRRRVSLAQRDLPQMLKFVSLVSQKKGSTASGIFLEGHERKESYRKLLHNLRLSLTRVVQIWWFRPQRKLSVKRAKFHKDKYYKILYVTPIVETLFPLCLLSKITSTWPDDQRP